MNQGDLIKKIQQLQPLSGNYTRYQSFNQIGLRGQRPVEARYKIYKLGEVLKKDMTVLDLGCNIGCLSLYIAGRVREVHGVERYRNYIIIAKMVKEHLGIYNCYFYNMDFMKFDIRLEFDLVLALAIHPSDWGGFTVLVDRVLRPATKTGGKLIFEERCFKRHIEFQRYVDYFMNVGFEESYRGMCQCPVDCERETPNHNRNFIVMEKL